VAFPPSRIFLDTNIYILGAAHVNTVEARILDWAGFAGNSSGSTEVEVVVSPGLFDEILRVSKRLYNKDRAGELVAFIWQRLRLHYVIIDRADVERVVRDGRIPREDAEVYVTARNGQAACFVSANHKLIRALNESTGDFECLTPDEFVGKYLR